MTGAAPDDGVTEPVHRVRDETVQQGQPEKATVMAISVDAVRPLFRRRFRAAIERMTRACSTDFLYLPQAL